MKGWAALALLLTACRGGASSADEAIAASNALIAESLPQVALDRFRIEARDQGGQWRVAYIPPDDATEGTVIIINVDKDSGRASWAPNDRNAIPVPPP